MMGQHDRDRFSRTLLFSSNRIAAAG